MSSAAQILILATLLAVLGMWLMLPRRQSRGRGLGMLLAAVAFGLGLSELPCLGHWLDDSVFLVLAAVTIVSAAAAVTFRNPVYCAIWFGQMLLGTAGLFLFTGAQFMAVATVVVYAGAILVTFLFVLMLAQPEGRTTYDRVGWESFLAATAGMAIVCVLSMTIGRTLSAGVANNLASNMPAANELAANILAPDHVARIGHALFERHLIAVEVAGTLLLAALVGAAAIIGREKVKP